MFKKSKLKLFRDEKIALIAFTQNSCLIDKNCFAVKMESFHQTINAGSILLI